jgi:hypothetical protein
MKPENAKAIELGEVLKYQMFATNTGFYQIELIRYEDGIYFVKKKDGKIVECCNLNKMRVNKE